MFEPGKPWWWLAPEEWHALGYGLMEGLKFWKRKPVAYEDVEKLPISPEWKADIKAKYHYYWTAFDLPEDAALVSLVLYYAITNLPHLMGLAGKFFGGN